LGDRLSLQVDDAAAAAALAVMLLAPMPPLLFMGEEWGSKQPFPFFCDFQGALADAVRQGRRREFDDAYAEFGDGVPDPLADIESVLGPAVAPLGYRLARTPGAIVPILSPIPLASLIAFSSACCSQPDSCITVSRTGLFVRPTSASKILPQLESCHYHESCMRALSRIHRRRPAASNYAGA